MTQQSQVNKLGTKNLIFSAWVTELESDWSKWLFGKHAPPERFWKSVLTQIASLYRPVRLDEEIAKCLPFVPISNQSLLIEN